MGGVGVRAIGRQHRVRKARREPRHPVGQPRSRSDDSRSLAIRLCAKGDRNELDYTATKDGKKDYTSRGPTLRGTAIALAASENESKLEKASNVFLSRAHKSHFAWNSSLERAVERSVCTFGQT